MLLRSIHTSNRWSLLPFLGATIALSACFRDPYEVIVIGSCLDEGSPAFLEPRVCTERVEERQYRPEAMDTCDLSGGTWTDDGCDREEACSCCVEERSTSTQTVCTYPTEGLSWSDEELQGFCEDPQSTWGDPENTWVNNPDVSCE